jgi:hypothetical protein
MSGVEIGRFDSIQADLLIGKLQSSGIPAFPLPTSFDDVRGPTGVLIDESDLADARAILDGRDHESG